MKISLIVAMSSNHVIGVDNRMPWHLSADLKRFRTITHGKPILMGRKTHESIGRPLPGRRNIILTHSHDYRAEGCSIAHTLAEAITEAGAVDELMIIGGSSLYERFLPEANRLYLTLIDREFDGDTFFPPLDMMHWKTIESETIDDDPDVDFSYRFLVLEKVPRGTFSS
ncbi:MAG: type 3 dihydrofolate reductase [Methylococcaceae bacterium]|nr:type 3 dihydrofolate reductase [Methylococcaceae bacterium]